MFLKRFYVPAKSRFGLRTNEVSIKKTCSKHVLKNTLKFPAGEIFDKCLLQSLYENIQVFSSDTL